MLSPSEKHADEVLDALEIKKIPVDVFEIARREKIELCPVWAGNEFLGRIEFHPIVNRFLLFYPNGSSTQNGRLRFSVAHELAHYYLPGHSGRLRAGHFHNSTPGFVCEKGLEREADEFAAALLLPSGQIKARLRQHDFLDLRELLKLAEEAHASRECVAIRYAKFAEEICAVVVSGRDKVLYSIASDDAVYHRVIVTKGSDLPRTALARTVMPLQGIVEGKANLKEWCPRSFLRGELWQEVVSLGYDDRALTVLSICAHPQDDSEEIF